MMEVYFLHKVDDIAVEVDGLFLDTSFYCTSYSIMYIRV